MDRNAGIVPRGVDTAMSAYNLWSQRAAPEVRRTAQAKAGWDVESQRRIARHPEEHNNARLSWEATGLR